MNQRWIYPSFFIGILGEEALEGTRGEVHLHHAWALESKKGRICRKKDC